jgi:TusA-related sulfurtransferase
MGERSNGKNVFRQAPSGYFFRDYITSVLDKAADLACNITMASEKLSGKANATIDCLGLYCPMPIVKTAQKFKELKPGEILEIVADDEGIKKDMPAWCQTTGNEFLGIEEEAGFYKVYVKKV